MNWNLRLPTYKERQQAAAIVSLKRELAFARAEIMRLRTEKLRTAVQERKAIEKRMPDEHDTAR